MDWKNVTLGELAEGLREVDWGGPRSLTEFALQRASFGLPSSISKWPARLKNNVYYYRTNYAVLFMLGSSVLLLRRPMALLGLLLLAASLMCLNDPFATALNDQLIRVVKRVHGRTAAKLRALVANNDTTLGPHRRTPPKLYILWLPRYLVVAMGVLLGLLLMWRSTSSRTVATSLAIGLLLPPIHATFRAPNLKARLTTAKEEFRAVWRGYQAGMVNDYTQ